MKHVIDLNARIATNDRDKERIETALRQMAETWPLLSDAERQQIYDDDPERFHALVKWCNEFLRARAKVREGGLTCN